MTGSWAVRRSREEPTTLDFAKARGDRDKLFLLVGLLDTSTYAPMALYSCVSYAVSSAAVFRQVRDACGFICYDRVRPYLLKMGCYHSQYAEYGRYGSTVRGRGLRFPISLSIDRNN